MGLVVLKFSLLQIRDQKHFGPKCVKWYIVPFGQLD
jgi:hypothetical protein